MDDNPYEVLQVDEGASPEVIQAAMKALTRKYHPDGGTEPDAEAMGRVNAAYATLSDPRHQTQVGAGGGTRTPTAPGPPPATMAPPTGSGYAPPPRMGAMARAGGSRTNTLSWVSFLVTLLCFGPLGFILALVARGQIKRSGGAETGMGWVIATFVLFGIQVAAFLFFVLVVMASSTSSTV